MTLRTTTDDNLIRHLEAALDAADDARIKYHLREALQLRISRTEWERDLIEGPRSD